MNDKSIVSINRHSNYAAHQFRERHIVTTAASDWHMAFGRDPVAAPRITRNKPEFAGGREAVRFEHVDGSIRPPPTIRVSKAQLAVFTAGSLVLAWHTSAFYFVMQTVAHWRPSGPVWVYAPLAVSIAIILRRRISKNTCQSFAALALLVGWLALSSLWSESHIYVKDKLFRLLVSPILFFAAGYFLSRSRRESIFAFCTAAFSLLVCSVIWVFGIDLASFLNSLQTDVLDYQRLGMLVGSGAALSFTLIRRSPAGAIFLLLFVALGATSAVIGGRTGAMLVAVGPIVRWRHSIFRTRVIVVGALLVTLLTYYMEDIAYFLLHAANVPDGIARAAIATLGHAKPNEYTRGDYLKFALHLIYISPVWGVGLGGFAVASGLADTTGIYPHNVILELLTDGGVIALLLAVVVFVPILRRFNTTYKEREADRIWTIFGISMTIAMFVGDLPTQVMVFCSLGMMAGRFDDKRLSAAREPISGNERFSMSSAVPELQPMADAVDVRTNSKAQGRDQPQPCVPCV